MVGWSRIAAGDTFSGALANVKAALSRLGEGPGKIALESLRKTFNAAIPAVDALSSQLTPFVEQLNGKLTPYVDRAVKLIEQFSQGLQDGSITVQDIAAVSANWPERSHCSPGSAATWTRSPTCSTRSAKSATADSTNSPRA